MSLTNKRILITGIDGFIGRHLIEKLENKGVEVIKGSSDIDIRKWKEIKRLIKTAKRLDIIFHLAAITYVPFSWEEPRVTYETNILGTLNILELCRSYSIKKLIFVSSFVYGTPRYLPIDETHPVMPGNPYTRSKRVAEELCETYHEDYGLSVIILRPFNIYGEGQSSTFLIPSIIKQILEKGEIKLKDPTPKRDFLYISDMVNACLSAALYENSKFEVFNIGAGRSYSVKEIVEKVIKIYGKKIKVSYTNERRKHEIIDVVADISKAKEKLAWSPKIGIEEGLKTCFDKMLKASL